MHRRTPRLSEPLESTLSDVARIAASLKDDWWIIGSAALALIGVDVTVADVDLLASRRDALAMSAESVPQGRLEGSDRFQSVYRRYALCRVPVEIMGDLHVRVLDQWEPVRLVSRIPVAVRGEVLFIPNATEQLRLLRLFGREKDLSRAAALVQSGSR